MSAVEQPKMDDPDIGDEDPSVDKDMKSTFRSGIEEEYEEVTWGDVCRSCFCHSPMEWVQILINVVLVCFFLFFFILGLEILGDGAQVMTGCAAGGLFGDDMNPIAALMVGVLCTVCMQSSSTTTSIIVSLVGAEAIPVQSAIYMVMGANIGTSVTNTIVAMGQLGDGDQLERAFAGATVHDMFNWLTVAVLLPVEVITGYLYHLTEAMSKNANTGSENGDSREGFVKRWIEPIGKLLISSNKDVIKHVANGGSCDDFYPTSCEDPGNPTKSTCEVGLISCIKKTDACPALFESGASQSDDELGGIVAFLVGIAILFICLGGLVAVLQHALLGASQKIIRKATDLNGYVSMLIGAGLTIAVQSSSITTSTLTPLVGLDIITLEMMLPLTLGANIGTCVTSLLAAMVTDGTDALQVALAHLFFNITGIIIWYPIPFMRAVPLHAARQLGKVTRVWKGFPIVYIIILFFLAPLALLGISSLFTLGTTGGTAAGAVLVVLICLGVIWFVWWWRWRNGKEALGTFFGNRQKRSDTRETLPYDMYWAKRQIKEMREHTGCPPLESYPDLKETTQNPLNDVHIDMKYVDDMVCALLKHVGMSAEDCSCDAEGRFKRKESEIDNMNDVDLSGWRNYHIAVVLVSLAIVALIFWGIGILYVQPSVSSTAMAGFLTICVGAFLLYRAYCFFFDGGRAKSRANYKDMQLRKQYMESYAKDINEVKADIDNLVQHTNMPALTEEDGSADEETVMKENGSGDEEDQREAAVENFKSEEEGA